MQSHYGECDDCGEIDSPPRWHHRFRQSWLKEAMLCPERARLTWAQPELRRETDAASVGSAVHTAIETTISCELTLGDAIDVFSQDFAQRTHDPGFVWVKYDERKAVNFGVLCVQHWYRDVYPTLDPNAKLEQSFLVPLIDDEHRLVEVEGTIDYFDGGLKDWKTSGRGEYVPWEHKRWDVQATVYTYAAQALEWTPTGQATEFELVIMHPKGVQRLMLERTPGHWDWLAQQSEALAIMIEAELPVWVKQDNHALCSAKWCDAWAVCKGRDL